MVATHYNPHPGTCDEDIAEVAPCGTFIGEQSSYSGDWSRVTCKKCLRKKEKIMQALKE